MRHALFSLLFALLATLASVGHGAFETNPGSGLQAISVPTQHAALHGGQLHTHIHASADHSQTHAPAPTSPCPALEVASCSWRAASNPALKSAAYAAPERPPRA